MGEYSKFISSKRRSVPTPKDMVADGKCVFGTFDKEFETMDMLRIKNPTAAPDFLKRFKLTIWQATEVHFNEGVLLAVCCDMGIFGKVIHVFYDKRKKKVYHWESQPKSKDTTVAENLLNGSKSHACGDGYSIDYINNFQDGKCQLKGSHHGDDGDIEYSFSLSRLSKPSVVSIPFDDINKRHRPLYSQKDFFTADGYFTFNGETFKTTPESTAIVDDHKGYYPRKAHYDWVTTMGVNEANGEKKWFAFNLTRNQSVDQNNYNENIIWFENKTSLLPPVTFERSVPTIDFKDYSLWKIKDEYDMVNIQFDVYDVFKMITHAKPFVNIEYFVVFGELRGYVRDEDGNKYILDGMMGMGEDKDLLL